MKKNVLRGLIATALVATIVGGVNTSVNAETITTPSTKVSESNTNNSLGTIQATTVDSKGNTQLNVVYTVTNTTTGEIVKSGAYTDGNGVFKLQVPKGTYKISVKSLSPRLSITSSTEQTVSVKEGAVTKVPNFTAKEILATLYNNKIVVVDENGQPISGKVIGTVVNKDDNSYSSEIMNVGNSVVMLTGHNVIEIESYNLPEGYTLKDYYDLGNVENQNGQVFKITATKQKVEQPSQPSTQPVEPTKPEQPSQPSTQPVEPSQPNKSDEQSEAEKPSESVDSNNSEQTKSEQPKVEESIDNTKNANNITDSTDTSEKTQDKKDSKVSNNNEIKKSSNTPKTGDFGVVLSTMGIIASALGLTSYKAKH